MCREKNQKLKRIGEDVFTEAFRVFDKEQNGKLAVSELRQCLINLGDKITSEEVDEMLRVVQDKIDEEGQIATAATLARLLSHIPTTSTGPVKILIYDIHALQERFYFTDQVLPIFLSAIPLFFNRIQAHHWKEDIAIAFPDEGAWKRFGPQFGHKYPLIICTKVREGEKRIVKVKEGDPKGKHVFIIDDLVQTGGTLLECKAALRALGTNQVSAFVTHGVFPNDSWRRFANEDPSQRFGVFYITDSCPATAKKVAAAPPFFVLSLIDTIVQTSLQFEA